MQDHRASSALLDEAGPDAAATPAVHVDPLNYEQLRLLAESAVGVADTDANFIFHRGRHLELTTAAPGDEDILVPTFDPGKFPANVVHLQAVKSTDPHAGLHVHARHADAIFWSDAAVQKFLFPYIVSCAGTRASTVLGKVQKAWNHYPEHLVAVYALVHAIVRPDQELSLESAIHVVYARHDTPHELTSAPLNEFLQLLGRLRHEFPWASTAPDEHQRAVEYHRGDAAKAPGRADYVMLRALAEHACSLCDGPRYFVLRAGTGQFSPEVHSTLPAVGPGDIVIPAFTPTVPAHRPRLHGVWCKPPKGEPRELSKRADAIFWSSGSVEQFLYPYYAGKGGLRRGLEELVKLSYVWTGEVPPKPGSAAAGEPAAQAAGATTTEASEVYALIHMPSSEWTPELTIEEASEPEPASGAGGAAPDAGGTGQYLSPARGVGVIHRHGGETRVDTVERFMAEHWPAA